MRVDTHVHLWQRGDGHRVLIRERLAALDRDFTMDGLAPELDAAGVQRVILVSAAQEEAETDALLAAARAAPDRVLGVVNARPRRTAVGRFGGVASDLFHAATTSPAILGRRTRRREPAAVRRSRRRDADQSDHAPTGMAH